MVTIQELADERERGEEWKKDHPFQAFLKYTIWYGIIYDIPRVFWDTRNGIKYGFQRMFRGYDDRMVWSHYYENAKQNAAILDKLVANRWGHPLEIEDPDNVLFTPKENMEGRWTEALVVMREGFEAIVKSSDLFMMDEEGNFDWVAQKEEQERLDFLAERGLKLYVANYRSLWD
jgi:hypothetical protein